MSKVENIVIVDPTISGALLAPELKKYGYNCIAVHGRPLPKALKPSYRPQDFSHELYLGDSYEELEQAVAAFDPVHIITGNDPGVMLADQLAHNLKRTGNIFSLSAARSDKYEMQEALKRAGIRSIKQCKSSNLDDLLAWLDDHGRFPVVVKPLNSGGTDGVLVCRSRDMVVRNFNSIIRQQNIYGIQNSEVLIQEFIAGTEYVIDCVSCQGESFLVEMMVYKKFISEAGAPVYQRVDYFLPTNEVHLQIVDYNNQVLQALGVEYGPTHNEIMLSDDGPVLIEMGARMAGSNTPFFISECARVSQIDLTVDAFLSPDRFFRKKEEGQQFYRHACMYFLTSYEQGLVESIPGKDQIERLSSFHRSIWRAQPGKHQAVTRDIMSSPGLIYLLNEDKGLLERDVRNIEALEKEQNIIRFDAVLA